jgi:hypothetical protein
MDIGEIWAERMRVCFWVRIWDGWCGKRKAESGQITEKISAFWEVPCGRQWKRPAEVAFKECMGRQDKECGAAPGD